jgi:uncharacterized protein (DUF2164 family)
MLKLPREEKDVIVRNVQAYFEEERSETIGALGAEQFIDFMIKELGPHIYNKAIADVRAVIQERNNQMDDELYTLEKPITNRLR